MVAVAAKPCVLDDGCGYFRSAHGAGSAVVDIRRCGVCPVVAGLGGVDSRLSRLVPLAEAADLRAAAGPVRARVTRHTMVGRAVGGAPAFAVALRKIPAAAGSVSIFRAVLARHVGI